MFIFYKDGLFLFFLCVCIWGGVAIRYLCECQFLVAQAGCISVPFAFTCSREIPEIELCSFLGSRGTQLLRGHAHFIPCVPWPSPAGAEFSLWWSRGRYLLQLWFLPRAPRGSRRSWSSPRTLWGSSGAWLSRALGSLKCPCSPWDRWHLSLLWGDGGKTEY